MRCRRLSSMSPWLRSIPYTRKRQWGASACVCVHGARRGKSTPIACAHSRRTFLLTAQRDIARRLLPALPRGAAFARVVGSILAVAAAERRGTDTGDRLALRLPLVPAALVAIDISLARSSFARAGAVHGVVFLVDRAEARRAALDRRALRLWQAAERDIAMGRLVALPRCAAPASVRAVKHARAARRNRTSTIQCELKASLRQVWRPPLIMLGKEPSSTTYPKLSVCGFEN